jgi:hypothetical protein
LEKPVNDDDDESLLLLLLLLLLLGGAAKLQNTEMIVNELRSKLSCALMGIDGATSCVKHANTGCSRVVT